MKTLSVLIVSLLSTLTPGLLAAQIFVPDYPGEFHQLEFSHGSYAIRLTVFVSDTISWVDFADIEIKKPDGARIVRDTRFIHGVYKFTERGAEKIVIDLKDGLSIELNTDFSALQVLQRHRPPIPLEFYHRVKDPYVYHVRFPTETHPSPIFVAGMTRPTPRQPRRGVGWYPGQLKLHLIQRGFLAAGCETLLRLH